MGSSSTGPEFGVISTLIRTSETVATISDTTDKEKTKTRIIQFFLHYFEASVLVTSNG